MLSQPTLINYVDKWFNYEILKVYIKTDSEGRFSVFVNNDRYGLEDLEEFMELTNTANSSLSETMIYIRALLNNNRFVNINNSKYKFYKLPKLAPKDIDENTIEVYPILLSRLFANYTLRLRFKQNTEKYKELKNKYLFYFQRSCYESKTPFMNRLKSRTGSNYKGLYKERHPTKHDLDLSNEDIEKIRIEYHTTVSIGRYLKRLIRIYNKSQTVFGNRIDNWLYRETVPADGFRDFNYYLEHTGTNRDNYEFHAEILNRVNEYFIQFPHHKDLLTNYETFVKKFVKYSELRKTNSFNKVMKKIYKKD